MERNESVIWPPVSGEYKVIQVSDDSQLYLRFGSVPEDLTTGDMHEDMVKRFASELGVRYEIGDRGAELPKPFVLKCAGLCELDLEARTALFKGFSAHYNLVIDQNHMVVLMRQQPGWTFDYKRSMF